jgi:transcriptional regulator with XRE-family HTH domain
MSLGTHLAAVRKEQKKSQSEVAIKADVHVNLLGRYEREEASPSVEIAARLADVLGVSLDFLVGKNAVEVDQALLDKLLTIQQLPDEDRQHILYAIDGLIQHAKNRAVYKK